MWQRGVGWRKQENGLFRENSNGKLQVSERYLSRLASWCNWSTVNSQTKSKIVGMQNMQGKGSSIFIHYITWLSSPWHDFKEMVDEQCNWIILSWNPKSFSRYEKSTNFWQNHGLHMFLLSPEHWSGADYLSTVI